MQGGVPTSLVMRERAQARQTYVQLRGDFLRKGDPVQPGYPEAIPSPPGVMGGRLSRLDMKNGPSSTGCRPFPA